MLVLPSGTAENKPQEEELCLIGLWGQKFLCSTHTYSSKISLLSIVISVKQEHDNPFSPSESSSRMLMLSKSSSKQLSALL